MAQTHRDYFRNNEKIDSFRESGLLARPLLVDDLPAAAAADAGSGSFLRQLTLDVHSARFVEAEFVWKTKSGSSLEGSFLNEG
jgi:hypothetical protein